MNNEIVHLTLQPPQIVHLTLHASTPYSFYQFLLFQEASPKNSKPKRKPPKRRKRFGKYSRTGGDRKSRASEVHATMNDDAHTTSITATTASALSNNNGKLRKQTKPELIKTA